MRLSNDYIDSIHKNGANKAFIVPKQKQFSYKRVKRATDFPMDSRTKIDAGQVSNRIHHFSNDRANRAAEMSKVANSTQGRVHYQMLELQHQTEPVLSKHRRSDTNISSSRLRIMSHKRRDKVVKAPGIDLNLTP